MSINRLQRPRLVIVGNGMAGMRTVEELVARAPDRFDITVIGGEPHPSYNHILLSSVLAGERTLAEIVIQPSSWYEKHGVHLIAGKRDKESQAPRYSSANRQSNHPSYDAI